MFFYRCSLFSPADNLYRRWRMSRPKVDSFITPRPPVYLRGGYVARPRALNCGAETATAQLHPGRFRHGVAGRAARGDASESCAEQNFHMYPNMVMTLDRVCVRNISSAKAREELRVVFLARDECETLATRNEGRAP
ncbi:hypothetical protein EVAR_103073_1 [Eumeta japonica]|uniref:Uncharacterized protein n=1 Tax=Eumeta variegata TaxID=151549 RepID=A0A4C1WML3_EUMVA|nr:hypothetical protein EVAR_103073_1 [Eumeta japonica]